MFELIERLRAKSNRTKKQVALLGAFLVSGVIFVVWLGVIYPNWRSVERKEDTVSKMEPSPVSAFSQTIANSLAGIGFEFTKLKETISSFSVLPEYYNATSSESDGSTTQ